MQCVLFFSSIMLLYRCYYCEKETVGNKIKKYPNIFKVNSILAYKTITNYPINFAKYPIEIKLMG